MGKHCLQSFGLQVAELGSMTRGYSHGGFGFQSSWGCALRVVNVLDEAFALKKPRVLRSSL